MAIRYITAPLSFKLESVNTLEFTIGKVRTVLFDFSNITLSTDPHAHYEGEYIIAPHAHEQHLRTREKIMDDDVTILRITADCVDNEKGGKTATIG